MSLQEQVQAAWERAEVPDWMRQQFISGLELHSVEGTERGYWIGGVHRNGLRASIGIEIPEQWGDEIPAWRLDNYFATIMKQMEKNLAVDREAA